MTTVIPVLQPHMLARWQEIAHIWDIATSYGRDLPLVRSSYPPPKGRLLFTFYGGIATISELATLRQAVELDMSSWKTRVLSAHEPTSASTRAANTAALLAALTKDSMP